MKKHIKFTDIGQFRNTIKDVHYGREKGYYTQLPKIMFNGRIKMHGTNAGVSYSTEDGMWIQSRKNIITVDKDNAGFAFFVESRKEWFEETLKSIHIEGYVTTLFGEWCGGNIQKGVALNGLDKMFVLFAIRHTSLSDDTECYYIIPTVENEEIGVYNIYNDKFPSYDIEVDFAHPELAQAEMVKLVEQIENECPVGKAFGVSGVGEGVVFSSFDKDGRREFIFKVKGEKHSSSKVKTLASVDVEKVNSIIEFVDYAVTENRLNQGIEQVFTTNSEVPSIEHTGKFLKWISSDVIKEEMDTLVENGLEPKDVGRQLSMKAREWYMRYLDKNV